MSTLLDVNIKHLAHAISRCNCALEILRCGSLIVVNVKKGGSIIAFGKGHNLLEALQSADLSYLTYVDKYAAQLAKISDYKFIGTQIDHSSLFIKNGGKLLIERVALSLQLRTIDWFGHNVRTYTSSQLVDLFFKLNRFLSLSRN